MNAQAKTCSNDYVITYFWMRDILGLKGIELDVYAIIYGYSHDSAGEYFGSLSYLQKWTGASKHTVIDSLKQLVNDGLVFKSEKVDNGVKYCSYKVNDLRVPISIDRCFETNESDFRTGGAEIAPVVQNLHWGSAKIAPNIIEDNKEDNKEKESKKKKSSSQTYPANSEQYRKTIIDKAYDERLESRMLDWLEYKTQRGDTYTPIGIKMLLTQLENNIKKHGLGMVLRVIDDSIANGYKGICYEKIDKFKQQEQPRRPQYQLLE